MEDDWSSALWQIFRQAARGASGILKTRGRQLFCDWQVDFSLSTPLELQVFSRHEVGPATFLRVAAELLKSTRALSVFARVFAGMAYSPVAAGPLFRPQQLIG